MALDVLSSTPHATEVSGEARLAHDGWVSEFEAFQWSEEERNKGPHGAVPASARSGRSGRSTAARGKSNAVSDGDSTKVMDNLRAEIKLLHWHKLANEAALKAALLKTKKIKARGGGTSKPVPAMTTLSMPTEDRAAWMQQVIEEEQSKPLQVSKDFMCKYEEQEKETEGRLDTEVAAHIRSLRSLRTQIEKRGEMKARRVKYRAAQKKLELEKQQLLLGKLHTTGSSGPASARRDAGERVGAGSKPGSGHRAPKAAGALDTVLGSLDKLVELEKRISSLEKSNVYDDFRSTRQGGAASTAEGLSRSVGRRRSFGRPGGGEASRRRSTAGRPGEGSRNRRLSFSKQTTEATLDAPSQTYYSVRVRQKPGSIVEDSVPRRRRTGGDVKRTSEAGPRARARVSSSRTGVAASAFLTQLPDVHRHPRAVEERPGGGGGFRTAIVEKKRIEAKRKLAGERAEAVRTARQDRIIREWMQRKKVAAATGNRQRRPFVLSRARGAPGAGGQRRRGDGGGGSTFRSGGAKSMHLQEFRDIRAHYAKRTERLRRDLSRKGPERGAFLAGTRTAAVATRPRAAPTASLPPFRPARINSTDFGQQQRGGGVSRFFAGTMRRGQARAKEEGGGGMRRVGQGLAIGGTGIRAARACSTRKRNGWHPQR